MKPFNVITIVGSLMLSYGCGGQIPVQPKGQFNAAKAETNKDEINAIIVIFFINLLVFY